MSIPLDRLYDYVESLVQEFHTDNIVIYRFYPHGSKNLDNLRPLREYSIIDKAVKNLWVKRMYTPTVIMHDQEPLDYHYYTTDQIAKYVIDSNEFNITHPEYLKVYTDMHIRAVSWCRNSVWDYSLLCHSEKNSQELSKYEQAGFIGVYWWSHAIIARDWFRFAQHDNNLAFDPKNIQYDFLIYNRAWSGSREYRLKFAELVLEQNLVPKCNIKFSCQDQGIHYTNHCFKNPQLAITRNDLELHYMPNTSLSSYSADYNNNDYTTSAIEIVLETMFDDSRLHLTEKSLRPIACGRPFILASTPGSLEYLRNYGFKTFDGIIDESYDTIQDPVERLTAITHEMQRLSDMPVDQKHQLWQELYAIAQYNKELFFSNHWQEFIINELKTNLRIGMAKLQQSHTGKYFKRLRDFYSKDPELTEMFLTTDLPHRTLEELNQILQFMDQK